MSNQVTVYWYQAITLTNDDLSSVRPCGIHMRAISQEMLKISNLDMNLKMTQLILQQHVPGAIGLNHFYFHSDMLSKWLHHTENINSKKIIIRYYIYIRMKSFNFSPVQITSFITLQKAVQNKKVLVSEGLSLLPPLTLHPTSIT